MNPLYVGIDVSSKNNVIYLMLPNGDKHSSFSLANSHDGSTQLVKRIFTAMTSNNIDSVLIGLEATSVYGDNLVYFLKEDATLASFDRKIHVLNPKQVNKFKESYNDLPKNDYIDAFVIADCLRFGRINKEVYMDDYRYKALQNLTRARYFAVTNLRLQVVLDCVFHLTDRHRDNTVGEGIEFFLLSIDYKRQPTPPIFPVEIVSERLNQHRCLDEI